MNFIFTNLNTITLIVWLVFFCTIATRFIYPSLKPLGRPTSKWSIWASNVQVNKWFVSIAIVLHLSYGIIATYGQYRAWAGGSELTRALFFAPLSAEVPLPVYLEWSRFLFEYSHGYFIFYSFGHFFLSTIALLVIIGLFLLFLVARSLTHPINFREGDISTIVLAMLIAGWPGVIVLLPIGFIFAVVWSAIARVRYGIERTPLSPAFLLAAPFALIFANHILSVLHLATLLKL